MGDIDDLSYDDHELSRCLAQYLTDNQLDFLVYDSRNDVDLIDRELLELCVKRFFKTLV